jgi:hypothetical protein
MVRARLGRLTASTTSTFAEVKRIRKLLARASLPTANVFEAVAARTIAYRLLADGVRRGVVRFADVLDLLPSHFFEYGREIKLAAVAAALKEFEKGLKDAL